MQTIAAPTVKDLVLLGGGHAHALVLRMWGMNPLPGVRLTLISNSAFAPYSGMLPGYLSGDYRFQEMHIDLRKLASFAGARFLLAEAKGIDLPRRQVLLPERPPIRFDLLSLDTGCQPGVSAIPGAAEHAIPLKPIPSFLQRFDSLVRESEAQKFQHEKKPKKIAVLGGGAGGVELALAIQTRFPGWEVRLIHKGEQVLPDHNRKARALAQELLKERGILLTLTQEACQIHANCVETKTGDFFPADEIFLVTQGEAPAWARDSGLAVDERGFVLVHPTLQSSSHPEVFAAGDVAGVQNYPRPKAGVFAVRQGRPLFENLRRAIRQQVLREYHPQERFLTLINTGTREAIASRGEWAYRSPLLWTLKDKIDRRFMEKFEALRPQVFSEEAPPGMETLFEESKLRCLGCGSKVGFDALENVLARLKSEGKLNGEGEEVLIGLIHPDDASVIRVPAGQDLVQSLDYLSALVSDPWLFGQIAVNHSLSDLYAMGATPKTLLVLALLPFSRGEVVEEDLYQLLSGVLHQAGREQVALIGGHTAEGPLALGLVANGFLPTGTALVKSKLSPGEKLILTKPLGVGTIFAAEMRGEGRADWVDAAVPSLLASNGAASRILREHGVKSCTDVTGFGLAGHLLEMLRASSQRADVSLSVLPSFSGAKESLENGIESSLHRRNRLASEEMEVDSGLLRDSRFQLLFDPQTSGGLLAGVPAENADACLRGLHAAGYPEACVIGEVLNELQATGKRLRVRL